MCGKGFNYLLSMAYIEISQGFLIFQVRRLPSTGRPSDRRTWWNSRFCWGTSCYFLQKISDTFGFSLHNCSHLVLFSRMNLLFVVMQSNTLSCWLQEPAIPKKTLFVGRFSPQTKPRDMLVAPLILVLNGDRFERHGEWRPLAISKTPEPLMAMRGTHVDRLCSLFLFTGCRP